MLLTVFMSNITITWKSGILKKKKGINKRKIKFPKFYKVKIKRALCETKNVLCKTMTMLYSKWNKNV